MYFTPHRTSAMAMFGFVYLWYLMAVLVLSKSGWTTGTTSCVLSQSSTGLKRWFYKVMTLGSNNISRARTCH